MGWRRGILVEVQLGYDLGMEMRNGSLGRRDMVVHLGVQPALLSQGSCSHGTSSLRICGGEVGMLKQRVGV